MTVKAGQPLEATVQFEAHPEPTVAVTFDGTSLAPPPTARIADDRCLVKVAEVKRPDQCGVFNVKLTNPYGGDSVDITLNVHGRCEPER